MHRRCSRAAKVSPGQPGNEAGDCAGHKRRPVQVKLMAGRLDVDAARAGNPSHQLGKAGLGHRGRVAAADYKRRYRNAAQDGTGIPAADGTQERLVELLGPAGGGLVVAVEGEVTMRL